MEIKSAEDLGPNLPDPGRNAHDPSREAERSFHVGKPLGIISSQQGDL
jgi:hypothetical protein